MNKEDLIREFEDYLNNRGLWFDFVQWLEEKGYKPEDLGFEEE